MINTAIVCDNVPSTVVSEHAFLDVICRDDDISKCTVFRIGALAGGHLCRESHPLCRLKDPTVVYMTTVGFHLAKPVFTMYTCS